MSINQVVTTLREQARSWSMAQLRRAYRTNQSAWVRSVRELRLADAEWHTAIKWHALMPEFEARGKLP